MTQTQKKDPISEVGRILTATPWAIAVDVAHNRIHYGTLMQGYTLTMMKKAVFEAVREALVEHSNEQS